MKTNYVQRPCLGINQSSLFNASDDMAQHASSRAEFILNPDKYLGKYSVTTNNCFNGLQKTSEICSPTPILICAVALAVVYGLYLVGVTYQSYITQTSTFTEGAGIYNMAQPGNSYMGIV